MPDKRQEIIDIFKSFDCEIRPSDFWSVQNTPVVLHKALERLAAKMNVRWDEPIIIRAERDEAVMRVTGRIGQRMEWSIGEALVGVNYRVSGKQAAYVYAIAEKRAKDRVILKLANIEALSEEEARDVKDDADDPGGIAVVHPPNPEIAEAAALAPATDSGESRTLQTPESTPFDFAAVLAEAKDQLTTVTRVEYIAEVVDAFRDDYAQMTRSQREIFDGAVQDATVTLKEALAEQERQRQEQARQRVEAAGGKGIRAYMDEDRDDAALARSVIEKGDPFDELSYETNDAETVRRLTDQAIKRAEATPDDEATVRRLHTVLFATAGRRKALLDDETRRDFVRRVIPLFDKHHLD